MRIITRYILREVTSHALLGGALFTFVIFMRDLGKILDLVVRDSASLTDVARIIAYTLPALTVTIPMAVLVGILLGLSRLASDSEITAMRASGIGALDFVRIVSIVSAVALALGLFNSLYLAPRAAAGLISLGESLKSSQASFEVQPRVFYEDFKNYVLYIQDVQPAAGASLWHHVFLADLTQPATPHITTADRAVVVNGAANTPDAQTIRLHLINGGQHETPPADPNQYNISTFASTDIPIETEAQGDTHLGRLDTPIVALTLPELWRRGNCPAIAGTTKPPSTASSSTSASPTPSPASSSCSSAFPSASPPNAEANPPASSSRSCSSSSTTSSPRSAKPSPNPASSRPSSASGEPTSSSPPPEPSSSIKCPAEASPSASSPPSASGSTSSSLRLTSRNNAGALANRLTPDIATVLRRFRSTFRIQFPLLLDDYVMREYATNFVLVLFSFSTLFIIFTFFELIGDIFRNRTPLITVGEYLINLIPYILYNVTPLCALVAVLITFGALSRTSELTAMKSTGISLYRIVTPVLITTILISAGLFAFDEFYLPAANRRQEALRSIIKDKPAQTFLRPDLNWISGQSGNAATPGNSAQAEPSRIFYYQFFNAEKNSFANLTVFEFDPTTFALKRRIFATSANWDPRVNNWVFVNGWQRTFSGETIASYQPFTVSTFPEIREQPSYFKKEFLPSQEMSYGELSRYIADLKQSGFDTKRLTVQLYKKLAYPLITLVMAILAIPFALSMGKKGSLAGIATAIGLAITYWVVALLFESMGNVNALPALLAAWTPDLLFGITGVYLLLRTPT